MGSGHWGDQKWVKMHLGQVGFKNGRQMVLNLTQWRVLELVVSEQSGFACRMLVTSGFVICLLSVLP